MQRRSSKQLQLRAKQIKETERFPWLKNRIRPSKRPPRGLSQRYVLCTISGRDGFPETSVYYFFGEGGKSTWMGSFKGEYG